MDFLVDISSVHLTSVNGLEWFCTTQFLVRVNVKLSLTLTATKIRACTGYPNKSDHHVRNKINIKKYFEFNHLQWNSLFNVWRNKKLPRKTANLTFLAFLYILDTMIFIWLEKLKTILRIIFQNKMENI